jgi:hypothetical protein
LARHTTVGANADAKSRPMPENVSNLMIIPPVTRDFPWILPANLALY